jgi:hypothetical protein
VMPSEPEGRNLARGDRRGGFIPSGRDHGGRECGPALSRFRGSGETRVPPKP